MSTPSSRRFLTAWSALLAAASALLCFHPVVEPDFFLHAMLGRDVLRSGSRVVVESASYIDAGVQRPVPQWLWSATHNLLYDAGGWALVYASMALVVAACAVALVVLLARTRPASPGAVVLISGTTMALAASRMRLRPQTLAILMAVGAILLSRRFTDTRGRARWLAAAGLIAVEVVWAQVHGSFVLVPMICVAVVWYPALRRREPRDLLEHGLLLALLGAGLLTSVWGTGVVDYVLHHAAGDAKQHISEWAAPTWASFHPLRATIGPTYAALWLVGLGGMIRARKLWWSELSLALLGLYLFSTALRFGAMGGILVAPLAVAGAAELGRSLPWPRLARGLAVAVALLVLIRFGVRIHDRLGPLGRVGMAEGHHPTSVARYLAEQPAGVRVLGDLSVGFAEAEELLVATAEEFPDSSMIWLKLGWIREAAADLEGAERAWAEVDLDDPYGTVALRERARVLVATGQSDEAAQLLTGAIDADADAGLPPQLDIHVDLVQLLADEGDFLGARQALAPLRAEDPALHARQLGWLHWKMGEIARAEVILNEAIQGEGVQPDASLLLADIYRNEGLYELGTEVLEAALARLDGPSAAQMLPRGRYPTSSLQQTQIRSYQVDVLARLAFLLGLAGQQDRALTTMHRVLLLDRDDIRALNFIGYTYAEQNRELELAEDYVREALTLQPLDPAVMDSLGWVLYRQGRLDEALDALEQARQRMPDSAVIWQHLGTVYLDLDRIEDARESLERCLETVDPDDPESVGSGVHARELLDQLDGEEAP